MNLCRRGALLSLVFLTIFAASPLLASSETKKSLDCYGLATSMLVRWRTDSTNALSNGKVLKTTEAREARIKATAEGMANVVLNFRGDYGIGDIPPINIFLSEGTMAMTRPWQYKPSEVAPAYKVSGLGKSGVVRFTLLGPVSGHNGNEKAKAWAKTDKYFVGTAQEADVGRSIGSGKPPASVTLVVDRAQSLALVTAHELELELPANKSFFVYYWREGSAGVAGYPSGRTIEMVWDGT